MSVAVGTTSYGENLARTVIRRLVAQDEAGGDVVLEPGMLIESYSIRRDAGALEVYAMELLAGGRALRCALVDFQARTEILAGSPAWTHARAGQDGDLQSALR